MNKIAKLFKYPTLLLLAVMVVGAVLRFYDLPNRFLYGHDHDLLSWFVKDVLVDHHLRLIGQETSTKGIFIGPLYYYLQIPLYLVFRMDPIALAVFSSLMGIFGIFSSYFVLKQVYDYKTGIIASIIYAVSFYVVGNDREAVMTSPVIIWSIWYFYSLHLVNKQQFREGFLLLGVLCGLIWHMNVSLVLVLPLLVVAVYKSVKKVGFSDLWRGWATFIVLSLPLMFFELRHGFIQVGSFINSLVVYQGDIYSGFEKIKRVLYLINKNFVSFAWGTEAISDGLYGILILTGLIYYLNKVKKITNFQTVIFVLWTIIYFVFFSRYSKEVSEYYLNGLFVVNLVLVSGFLSYLVQKGRLKYLVYAFLAIYILLNVKDIILTYNKTGKNYAHKKALVTAIKTDMVKNNFDCAAISYITNPGYDFGYRYFFYWLGVKTKKVLDKLPVYTIIFPLGKDAVKADAAFGALGLIYPKDSMYPVDEVNKLCRGEDVNLTDPMWGLPK